LKVLHVITESNLGGAQLNTLLTVRGLVQHGYEVHLACGPEGPGESLALAREAGRSGVIVHVVNSLARPISPLRDLPAFAAIARLMAREEFDIVHTHSFKAGVIGRLAAWLMGVPRIVHTFHGVPFNTSTPCARTRLCFFIERIMCLFCHQLVSVGATLRDELIAHRVARPDKIQTIHSGVDFSMLAPYLHEKVERPFDGLPPDARAVGFVGRLSRQKAPDVLLEAFEIVKHEAPDAHLVFVGEGPMRRDLEDAASRKVLSDSVHLLGERPDVPRLLASMTLFALPSRWEGVGRALTEAMYMKLPVVATGVNGSSELVIDGSTALIARVDDPAHLAAKILALLNDPARAAKLGEAAHRKVREMMSAEAMVRDTILLYEKLTSGSLYETTQGERRVRHLWQTEP